jgi:hypothetical protein
LPDFGNRFANNYFNPNILMFHVEHAKNQKSAKIEFCGFFWVLTNIFGAGAPVVVLQRLFMVLPENV